MNCPSNLEKLPSRYGPTRLVTPPSLFPNHLSHDTHSAWPFAKVPLSKLNLFGSTKYGT